MLVFVFQIWPFGKHLPFFTTGKISSVFSLLTAPCQEAVTLEETKLIVQVLKPGKCFQHGRIKNQSNLYNFLISSRVLCLCLFFRSGHLESIFLSLRQVRSARFFPY